MRRWCILVLILLVGMATSALWAQKGDVAAGKAVYTKSCVSCHGPNGEGNQNIAKALKVELRGLASKEVQAKSDEQLRKDSVEGLGKMKPVKGLSDKDVANLMAYLRSLAKK